ncbi:MAG TPA: hypothetical protein VEC17_03665 [Candidatus Binatia bacterium]|nr:hypothetical protein [Candidatus Binatia bacterium]
MDKTFIAKKLGEVLAFCNVGVETFEKGRNALIQKYGESKVDELIAKLKSFSQELISHFPDDEMRSIGLAKAESTGAKLRTLRDTYVGDEWDNATELSEWSGFFEGAAIVHWQLVAGAAEGMPDNKLSEMAKENIDLHQQFLDRVSETLKTIGKQRAIA